MSNSDLLNWIERVVDKREKQALVLITGGSRYVQEIFEVLTEYRDVRYYSILSDNASQIEVLEKWKSIGSSIDDPHRMKEIIRSSNCLILPTLTRNTLAKIAMGIADNEITTAVQLGLLWRKPVIAVDASWNPDSEFSVLSELNGNQAYKNLLYRHRDEAEALGMNSVGISGLRQALKKAFSEIAPDFPHWNQPSDLLELTDGKDGKERQDAWIPDGSHPASRSNCSANSAVLTAVDPCQIRGAKTIITHADVLGRQAITIPVNATITDLAKEYIAGNRIAVNLEETKDES
ncbi:MAG: hypothetical protein K0Q48_878 [Bacillota bacterium]|nr:hypothetical protein [Bacillota bacterium]